MARPPVNAILQPLLFALITLLFALSLLPGSRPLLKHTVFLVLTAVTVYCVYATRNEDLQMDFTNMPWITLNWLAVANIVWTSGKQDVSEVFRKKEMGRKPKKGIEKGESVVEAGESVVEAGESVVSAPFFTRFKWAFDLYASSRGIGWEHEPTAYLPHRTPSKDSSTNPRLDFLLYQQIPSLVRSLLCYTVGGFLMQLNPMFRPNATLSVSEQPWWLQPTVLGQILVLGSVLNILHVVLATMVVFALGAPLEEWDTPLFGNAKDATSVHESWRRAWHQLLRVSATGHTNRIASLVLPQSFLQAPRGTMKAELRGKFKLFTAFFLSGLFHLFGEYALLFPAYASFAPGHGSIWEKGGSYKFFVLQACAIVAEDIVSWAVQKIIRLLEGIIQDEIASPPSRDASSNAARGLKACQPKSKDVTLLKLVHTCLTSPSIRATVGYIWVGTWFTVTLPLFTGTASEHGVTLMVGNVPGVAELAKFARSQLAVE
ncbi:hypothetical protein DFP72DRAFT_530427 [Ephemerocybe angulata]|uniref:Wax synthase domain-containing protein n=1 Tax=Ephemerocybe angulata TaxID=980116 RepID=A0A8H6MFI9_9AGAR|nr:hypothetical protein DFP72DRAFT_530427 [Tulosesus angulatus]